MALLQTLLVSGVIRSERGEVGPVSDFKGRHFEGEVVLWAVRWYCRYGVSYRDLEQMMGERGVSVDHSTIYHWVQKYAPEIERRLRWQWRQPRSTSWRVDETCIKVCGQWAYLYRAVDKFGDTIDFYLSPTRNTAAAKRFLGKALKGLKHWELPHVVNTDKAPTYGECPKNGGIMPRWPTARSGWHAAETGGPTLSRAFHCRRRSEPGAGDRRLFGTSASAATCSFAD